MAVNSTEQFVFELCERTFLSAWCYSNPKGKDQGQRALWESWVIGWRD